MRKKMTWNNCYYHSTRNLFSMIEKFKTSGACALYRQILLVKIAIKGEIHVQDDSTSCV